MGLARRTMPHLPYFVVLGCEEPFQLWGRDVWSLQALNNDGMVMLNCVMD